MQNLSDAVMHTFNPSDTFVQPLSNLNATDGFVNMDPPVTKFFLGSGGSLESLRRKFW